VLPFHSNALPAVSDEAFPACDYGASYILLGLSRIPGSVLIRNPKHIGIVVFVRTATHVTNSGSLMVHVICIAELIKDLFL
jgi:hypothetical protein